MLGLRLCRMLTGIRAREEKAGIVSGTPGCVVQENEPPEEYLS